MSDASAIRAGKAVVELGVDDKISAGLNKAAAKLKAYGATVGAAGRSLMTWGGAVLAPLALAGKQFSQAADDLANMSARTGASTEWLSALGFAAQVSGTSLEALEPAIRKLQVQGYTAGQTTEAAFMAAADAIAAVAGPGEKAALAVKLFGKSGTALLPMLKEGTQGLRAMMLEAQRLGLVMSAEDVAAGQKLDDALDRLTATATGAWRSIGAALAPALSDAAAWLSKAAGEASQWVRAHQPIIVLALKAAAAVAAAGAALFALGKFSSLAGSALHVAAIGVSAVGAVLGAILSPIGLVVFAIGGLAAAALYITDSWQPLLAWLGSAFDTLSEDIGIAVGGITDALATGDVGGAAKILWDTLKLEWTRGVNALSGLWQSFKTWMLTAAQPIAAALLPAWQGIATGFIEAMDLIRKTWDDVVIWIMKTWDRIKKPVGGLLQGAAAASLAATGQISAAIRAAQGAWATVTASNAEAKPEDYDALREQRRVEAETWRRNATAGVNQITRQATDALGSALEAQIGQEAESLTQAQADLDAARANLNTAASSAHTNRLEFDRTGRIDAALEAFFGPVEASVRGAGLAMVDRGTAAGTFSSNAAQVLGAGSLAERQLRTSEAAERHLASIDRSAERGGTFAD